MRLCGVIHLFTNSVITVYVTPSMTTTSFHTILDSVSSWTGTSAVGNQFGETVRMVSSEFHVQVPVSMTCGSFSSHLVVPSSRVYTWEVVKK